MYIRTKYGVYENAHPYFTEDNKVYMRWDYPSNIELKFLGDIIKQADTIEELCDCIIETKGHTGDYFHYTYTAFDEPSKERLLDDMINQDFEVYYAIWTSKGLIYVAKMDSDGKLELI